MTKPPKTPFKKIPDASRRTVFLRIRLNASERADIQEQAQVRNLSTSDYVRRSTLHRRADVKIETKMILEVREAVMEIRKMRADYLDKGIAPPDDVLRTVLGRAEEAIMGVANY